MKSITLIALALWAIVGLKASAQELDILWADVDDIVAYAPKAMPDAKLIQTAANTDARFTAGQAQFKFGLHFEYMPITQADGSSLFRADAMMTDKKGELFFRKFDIKVAGQPRAITDVQILADTPLKTMHFTVNTGLIDRMVVLEDVENDVMLVFPLGVGGLDEGVLYHGETLLTPQFHKAWLDRRHVNPARTSPAYYRGKPFMPITNAAGTVTPFAFHITILSDQDWKKQGGNYLVRGFESHGCMRLRQKDLMQFFTIVEKGADARLPVNVDYFVWNRNEWGDRDQSQGQVKEIHPYPLENSYMRIKNFARPGQTPVGRRDGENLYIMEQVNQEPNLSKLRDFNADDVKDDSVFDGLVLDMDKDR